jgi:hypothetical protein
MVARGTSTMSVSKFGISQPYRPPLRRSMGRSVEAVIDAPSG